MTFTIRKMSGKGIHLVARYLSIVKFGGRLEDTPEAFYTRWSNSTGEGRHALEQRFAGQIDLYEEKLRDEDGFLSRNDVQKIAEFVQKKIGTGMWIEGEIAADHHRDGNRVAKPKAAPVSSARDVSALVKQLKSATDPEVRRKLRRQLRKLGHRGGSRA